MRAWLQQSAPIAIPRVRNVTPCLRSFKGSEQSFCDASSPDSSETDDRSCYRMSLRAAKNRRTAPQQNNHATAPVGIIEHLAAVRTPLAIQSATRTAMNCPLPTGSSLHRKDMSARTACMKAAISVACEVALSTTNRPVPRLSTRRSCGHHRA